METFQVTPVKLYIQDIFRAKRTDENKYIYELFGITFKNIMIHGTVTALYNTCYNYTNLELSDCTGSVQIYYEKTKNNYNIPDRALTNITHEYNCMLYNYGENVPILRAMKDAIVATKRKPFDFEEGAYLAVTGDIFLDDLKNTRMISAYECNVTSVERDIVWLEELQYLYEKFYLWKRN